MKKLLYLLAVGGVMLSCNDEGTSNSEAELLSYNVSANCACSSTFSETVLDKDYNIIHILSNSELKSSDYPVAIIPEIEISAGATITPAINEQISFASNEDRIEYIINSEDEQTNVEWYAIVRDRQLPNSDFETWHDAQGMDGNYFKSPGMFQESTVWATANMGTSTYGVYGTTPMDEGGNTRVKIESGETVAIPVTAGTLFIGRFDLAGAIQNPSNPKKATDFGIPFIYKPKAIEFNRKYTSGDQLIQASLNNPNNLFGGFEIEELEGKDEYNIYAMLEKRTETSTLEIARAEIRGSDTGDQLETVVLPFVYQSDETPTHFSLVFTSSADGDIWKGAVGSTLVIDDVKLIYE